MPPVDTFSYDDQEISKYNKNIEAANFLFMECIYLIRETLPQDGKAEMVPGAFLHR